MGNRLSAAGSGTGIASPSSASTSAGGGGGGGCPIKSTGEDGGAGSTAAAAGSGGSEGGCPVKGGAKKAVYNVYAQPIDPTNQMPANPNQQPAPGQAAPLSTDRVASGIPKGGTAETWTYPSPQMFWNALVRKGKAEGAKEEDMAVVVAIHNNMNENTWRQVLEWERLHAHGEQQGEKEEAATPPPPPRLSRFMGRPDELSPKAWIKSVFGHPLPFDRHDWIVERPDGTEVRYVIDYYHDDGATKENRVPSLHDVDSVKSISIDVRPALDSVDAMVDRAVRMPIGRRQGRSDFKPLPFFWQGSATPEEKATATAAAASCASSDLAEASRRVQESCAEALAAVRSCKGEAECGRAAVGLTLCMAQLLCPEDAKGFNAVWASSGGGSDPKHEAAIEASFTKMRTCLDDFETQMRASQRQQEKGT